MFKDPRVCKTVVDQFPTPRGMVRIEALSDERLAGKMSVLHCQMMSHEGELLVIDLNDKFTASDDAFIKTKATHLASDLNQVWRADAQKDDQIVAAQTNLGLVCRFLASDEFNRVRGELLSLAASVGFERRLHMDWTQDQLVGALKKITYFVPGAQEQNEEWVNAMVKMVDVTTGKSAEVLVQGVVHQIYEDVNRVERKKMLPLVPNPMTAPDNARDAVAPPEA
ncbi:hypothetical protein Tco_1155093 [Tanacetum coccineum]